MRILLLPTRTSSGQWKSPVLLRIWNHSSDPTLGGIHILSMNIQTWWRRIYFQIADWSFRWTTEKIFWRLIWQPYKKVPRRFKFNLNIFSKFWWISVYRCQAATAELSRHGCDCDYHHIVSKKVLIRSLMTSVIWESRINVDGYKWILKSHLYPLVMGKGGQN